MPILRIDKTPYYLTISELSKLPILKKLVMYEDINIRNKPFSKEDEKILINYIENKIGEWQDYRFRYINLEKKEAECAVTELILYHTYFFCKNTVILGNNRPIDTSSNKLTLNDLIYPYNNWNAEIIFNVLTIKSGDSYFTVRNNNIERIIGFFREFKVIMTDTILTFAFGKIYIEPRNTIYSSENIEKFFKHWKEKKPLKRLLNNSDKRNYKNFVFYLNDKYIYSNYTHPRFFRNFEEYKNANSEIFE
ncbi:hypothetical protein [Marinilabilia salmonicolor]|uniref:hypothetical protein n=1 Tax=Marinilabilia salmonicolor TaxID=989 RepID=UPI00029AFE85|nr:hypothetical protein [Marinilabilia salmonicolor]